MKKSLKISGSLILACALVGSGFLIGQQAATSKSREIIEGISLQGLASHLLILRFIERGEVADARKVLQGETNGLFSWVIENATANPTPEQEQQKCKVLNTLKQYRAKHQLFTTRDWDYLWNVPGMKEEEAKRQAFLTQMNCGDVRLFKIE